MRTVCIPSGIALVSMSALFAVHGQPLALDRLVVSTQAPHDMTWANRLGAAFSQLGSPATVAAVAFTTVVAVLCLRRDRWLGLLALIGPMLVAILETVLKHVVGRLGPVAEAGHDATLSFPSGHAAGITAALIVLTLTVTDPGTRQRRVVAWLSVVPVLVVGVARVAERAHWPTDVAGGIALGVVVSTVSAVVHDMARQAGL